MRSTADTVEDYPAELPEARREALGAVRRTILDHLPAGYEETVRKSCVRFKHLDDLPLDLLGRTIAAADVDAFLAVAQRR